jgi:hypothetical protein
MEIGFNVAYLVAIWTLVVRMYRRRDQVAAADRGVAEALWWAFALLALGDTGHVGFRVWAYALGGLEDGLDSRAFGVPLVGAGALATAVTVTLFYVLMLVAWHRRFSKPYGVIGGVLFAAAAVRLLVMLFPQNQWAEVVPPHDWSLYRNLPLVVQGLGVAFLILRDARRSGDHLFRWIGIWILVSFAFYAPVILFVQEVPAVGMLMIPKTLAYLAVAWLVYRDLFARGAGQPEVVAGATRSVG